MLSLLFEARLRSASRWGGWGAWRDLPRAVLLLGAPLPVEVVDRREVYEAVERYSGVVLSGDVRCGVSLRWRDSRDASRALVLVEGYEGEAELVTGVPWPLESLERCDVVVEG